VAITAPGPRPPHRFWRCCDRWMTISRHPEPCAGPLPSYTGEADSRRSLRPTCLPTVSPADFHPVLGPRSLDPDRSFWSAYAELIRGQMPPTDFCKLRYFDVRARTRALVPRWDDGLDHLPVLTRKRPLPCGSGSERRVALRPISTTPLPVPPTCVGLPDLDTVATAPPPNDFRRRCVVTIDEHESEDRVKDIVSPGRKRRFCNCPCVRCVRLERSHAHDVPLLGVLRTSAVAGARAHKRGSSCRRRGPTEARTPPAPREGNRLPANQDAFHRHAPPSVHRIAPARGT
jgi:hypothetical protein